MRGAAASAVISAAMLASGARAQENGAALASRLSVPRVNAGVYCLWQSAEFGTAKRESAAWLVEEEGALSLVSWPSATGSHRSAWRGRPPAGAIAVLHTHPREDGPRPSFHDTRMARALEMPVAAITREGVFTALPDGRIVQDLASDWHAAYRGLALRDCDAPPPGAGGAPAITTSAAFAPAGDRGSWRRE